MTTTTNTNQSAPPEFSGVSTIVEKRGGEELAWLATLGPLSSPEELAEPLVEAICGLWNAFEDRAITLEWLSQFGPDIEQHRADARKCVDTAQGVAAIVAATVSGCSLASRGASASDGVVAMVRGLVGAVDELQHQMHFEWNRTTPLTGC
jgi:hypothetical protein